jgi:hypothetical protein
MDWNELLQWSQKGFIASCALVVQLTLSLAVGLESKEVKPRVSDKPLATEQLAVYRAFLETWYGSEKAAINLSVETNMLQDSGQFSGEGCLKGLNLEENAGDVHRFRTEDLPQLGPFSFRLVDSEKQRREVADNDPGKAIHNGTSVDDAVRNGFSHALFTLSEIRFDKDHTHAVVAYSFVCGELCGNGGIATLEKKNGAWHRQGTCGEWQA